jgi:hypothetical protein
MWMFTFIVAVAIITMVLSVGVSNIGYKWTIAQILALFCYDVLIATG